MTSSLDYLLLLGQARWYQSESSVAAFHPNVPRLHQMLSSLPDPLEALNKANAEFLEWIRGATKEKSNVGHHSEEKEASSLEQGEEGRPLSFHGPLHSLCLSDRAALEECILPQSVPTLSLKDVMTSARVWDRLWFWVSNMLARASPSTSTDETSRQDPLDAFCLSQLGTILHSQLSALNDDGQSGSSQGDSFVSFLRCWIPWVLVSHQFEDSLNVNGSNPSSCKTSFILYEVTKHLLFSPLLADPHPIVADCSVNTRTAAAATVAWVTENVPEEVSTQLSTLSPLQVLRRAKLTSSPEQLASDPALGSTPWRAPTEASHAAMTEGGGGLFSIPSIFQSLHTDASADGVLGSGWGYDVERDPGPFSLDDLETLQQQIEYLDVEAEQALHVEAFDTVNTHVPPATASLFGNLSQTLEQALGQSAALVDGEEDNGDNPILSFDDEADFLQSPSQTGDVPATVNLAEEVDSTLANCSADTLLYFLTSAIADSDVSCSTALNILDSLQQSVYYPSMSLNRGNGKLSKGFQELVDATERTMEHRRLEHAGARSRAEASSAAEETLKMIHSRKELVALRDTSIPLLQISLMRNPVLLRLGYQVARGSETWGNRDFLFALHALSALELVPRSGHSQISGRIYASLASFKVGELAIMLEVCAQSQILDQGLLDSLCNAAVMNFNQSTGVGVHQSSSALPSELNSSNATTSLQLNSPVEEYCRQLARMANALNTLRYCHLAFYSTVAIWLGYGVGHTFLDRGTAKAIRRYVDEVRSQLNQITSMSPSTLSVSALTSAIDRLHQKSNSVQDIDESLRLGESLGNPSTGKEVFLKFQGELMEILSQIGWPSQGSSSFPLLQRLPASVLSLDQLSMLKLLRCLRHCTNLAIREGDGAASGTFPQEASLRRFFQLLSEAFSLSLKGSEVGLGGDLNQTEGRLLGNGPLEGKVVARLLAAVRPYQTTSTSPPEPSWFFTLRSGILAFLAEKLSAKGTIGAGEGEGQNLASMTWSDVLQALQCLRNSALGQASVQNVLLALLRGVAATSKEQGERTRAPCGFFDLNSYLRVAQLLSRFQLSSTVRLAVVDILLEAWAAEELSTTLGAATLLDASSALFWQSLSILQNLDPTQLDETQRNHSLELNRKLFDVLDLALVAAEPLSPSAELILTQVRTDEMISALAELPQTPALASVASPSTKSRLISLLLHQIQAQLQPEVVLSFLANALWLLGRFEGHNERLSLEFPVLASPAVKETVHESIQRLLHLLRSIVKVKVVERLKVDKEKGRSPSTSDEIKAFLKVLDTAVLLPGLFRGQDALPGFGSLTEAVAICVALRWPLLTSNEYCQAANLLIQLDIFDVYLIEELQRKTDMWAELHHGALPLDIVGGWNLLSAWERLHGITPTQYRCLELICNTLTVSNKEARKATSAESGSAGSQNNSAENVIANLTPTAAATELQVLKPTASHLEGKLLQLKAKFSLRIEPPTQRMSAWSRSSKRVLLHDVNQHRYSNREVLDSNPGPASYTPKAEHHIPGSVAMPSLRGKPEREKILSNGAVIEKLLPLGPGSYTVPDPPSPRSYSGADAPFGSKSPRRTEDSIFIRTNVVSPGPGAYIEVQRSPTDRVLSPRFGTSPRPVCLPLVRESSHSPNGPGAASGLSPATTPRSKVEKLPSPRGVGMSSGLRSPRAAGAETQDDRTKGKGMPLKQKGTTISSTPRYMNLHNLNSLLPRERDPDYANPPPGAYSVRHEAVDRQTDCGRISLSKRTTDLANRNGVPGPGAYGGDSFTIVGL